MVKTKSEKSPRMVPRWSPDDPWMVKQSRKKNPRMVPRWSPDDPWMVKKVNDPGGPFRYFPAGPSSISRRALPLFPGGPFLYFPAAPPGAAAPRRPAAAPRRALPLFPGGPFRYFPAGPSAISRRALPLFRGGPPGRGGPTAAPRRPIGGVKSTITHQPQAHCISELISKPETAQNGTLCGRNVSDDLRLDTKH